MTLEMTRLIYPVQKRPFQPPRQMAICFLIEWENIEIYRISSERETNLPFTQNSKNIIGKKTLKHYC